METRCPLTSNFLKAAAHNNKLLKSNKTKTHETVKNPTLQAFGIIMNTRSRRAIAVQAINTVILRRGGCGKQTFKRFSSAGITTSYRRALALQEDLGEGFDDRVKAWLDNVESETKVYLRA